MEVLRINVPIMPLQILLVFLSAQKVTTDPFQPVSSPCIYWDSLGIYSNGHSKKLHCILDEDEQLGLVNATWKWVENGSCPYFDRYSNEVNMKPCDVELGKCPEKEIYSYQAVKYSACYNTHHRSRSDSTSNKKNPDERDVTQNTQIINGNCNNVLITGTALSVLIVLVIVGIYIYEKYQQNKKSKRERSQKVGTSPSSEQMTVMKNGQLSPEQQSLLTETYSERSQKVGTSPSSEQMNVIENGQLSPKLQSFLTEKKHSGDRELMILCLELVAAQFSKEPVDFSHLASEIQDNEREFMKEKFQKVLNTLS